MELLKGGANPCSTDHNGLCALHFATWNGHCECVDYLLVNDLGHQTTIADGHPERRAASEYTSCVDLLSKAGWNSLHIAAFGCKNGKAIAKRLLIAGVNPSLRDNTGATALDIAKRSCNLEIIEALAVAPPSIERRRVVMAALEEKCTIVRYRWRPPRPFERDSSNVANVVSPDASEHPTTGKRTLYSPTMLEDEELLTASDQAPVLSGREAAVAYAEKQKSNKVGRSLRMPPTPRELTIPEHEILAFAKLNASGPRATCVIHNLRFAVEEAQRNLERRQALAEHQTKAHAL